MGALLLSGSALADGAGNTDTEIDGCMEDVAGFGLNCTANDIQIASVTNLVIDDDGCAFPGDTVTFTADFEVLLTAQARHDLGLWFATDGDPNADGAITGACTVGTPAYAPDPPWLDLDGMADTFLDTNVVSNIQDTCGDIDAGHNPLFPQMTITATCIAGPDGNLSLPNCTSWKQPGDNDLCTNPLPVANVGGPGLDSSGVPPGAPSKCRCDEGFTVPIPVPAFIVVDKVTLDPNGDPLPNDPTLFDFSITGPGEDLPDLFMLDDNDPSHFSPPLDTFKVCSAGSPSEGEICAVDADGGDGCTCAAPIRDYQATETVPAGWELDSASCTSDNATPIDPTDDVTFDYTNGADINLAPGETVTCTFTNKFLDPCFNIGPDDCQAFDTDCAVASCSPTGEINNCDILTPEFKICRTGSGDICDPDEFCDGVNTGACPADNVASATTVCNPGSGDICDPDESCSGVAGEACPADSVASATTGRELYRQSRRGLSGRRGSLGHHGLQPGLRRHL
jgi:hypothetical protein